jgi:hypothetical protein
MALLTRAVVRFSGILSLCVNVRAASGRREMPGTCSSNRVEVFTADHFPLNVESANEDITSGVIIYLFMT